jgi:hypothetical protein
VQHNHRTSDEIPLHRRMATRRHHHS